MVRFFFFVKCAVWVIWMRRLLANAKNGVREPEHALLRLPKKQYTSQAHSRNKNERVTMSY